MTKFKATLADRGQCGLTGTAPYPTTSRCPYFDLASFSWLDFQSALRGVAAALVGDARPADDEASAAGEAAATAACSSSSVTRGGVGSSMVNDGISISGVCSLCSERCCDVGALNA